MGGAEDVGRVSAGNDASTRHTYGEATWIRRRMFRLAITELANETGPLDRVQAVSL
jgi:hypothetical protein